ncbi:MAG: hypothetical protein J6X69_09315 [Bacteroidales bacterium]|nr:hypothetical protein [Bacteroidales bacterium]
MKQNDSYQDFDKQVQQLLGQASEPVPEGAWEAIAARLAAGAGAAATESRTATAGANAPSGVAEGVRKAVILRWVRRTGFAVAAAAAVLLAVLLWNRPEETTDDQLAVVTEQTQEPVQISGQPQEPTLAASLGQSAVSSGQKAVSPGQSSASSKQNAISLRQQTKQTLAQAEIRPAESQTETPTEEAQAEFQTIDWEHLPDLENEAQARAHKKYQPNSFHLAAYTNALSNFTSKKSGQHTGYSGVSGGGRPDHSYFRETGESSYTIPLTFGINFTYDVLPKLSIGLGVNYTRLSRHFSGTYYQLQADGSFDAGTDYDNIYNIQQFIGIPLSVYYHIVRTKHINFYVYANGTVEKCIGNAWTANNRAVNYNEPVKGVQFNTGAGIGVDFMLTPLVSIYLDPNVKYYFGLNQPKSIRTKQPFMLGFEAGVRFHL